MEYGSGGGVMTTKTALFAIVALAVLLAASCGVAGEAYTPHELTLLAKTVWGEARGCAPEEQRLVIWTVFQRVGADGYGDTIEAVMKEPGQFAGFKSRNPVVPEIYVLCEAEAEKWARGENPPTLEPYAPEVPYYFFDGRRGEDHRSHNYFREEWR